MGGSMGWHCPSWPVRQPARARGARGERPIVVRGDPPRKAQLGVGWVASSDHAAFSPSHALHPHQLSLGADGVMISKCRSFRTTDLSCHRNESNAAQLGPLEAVVGSPVYFEDLRRVAHRDHQPTADAQLFEERRR